MFLLAPYFNLVNIVSFLVSLDVFLFKVLGIVSL